MKKSTVIAKVRTEIELSDAMRAYLRSLDGENIWIAKNGGSDFLAEFGHEWNSNFVEIVQEISNDFFRGKGLEVRHLPEVILTDSRRGSWIMEAALTMFGTVGTVYTILKGLSELPQIADGLEETKSRLQSELTSRFRKKIPERIEPTLSDYSAVPPPPTEVIEAPASVSCSIDARPLRSLTPDIPESHAIHLSVAVSRSSLSIENLGEEAISNLRIGVFKSETERHSWNFAEAYSTMVPQLSSKQSVVLSVDQFKSQFGGDELDLTEDCPLYVDCWLQDTSGIYLFNFHLE